MISPTGYYFILRSLIPYSIYIIYKEKYWSNEFAKRVNNIIVCFVSYLLIVGICGIIYEIPFKNLFFIEWRYEGFIEWGIFIIVCFRYLDHKGFNSMYSLNILTQCCSCGGWLYEIPFFHPIKMFIRKGIIINNQIVSIFLLMILLKEKDFKINKKIIISFFIYYLFSMHLLRYPKYWISIPFPYILKMFPFLYYHYRWLVRIPTLTMLVLLITGIKRNINDS